MDDNLPIIVGTGEVTQRPETERPREPLALMAEASRLAEADAEAGSILANVDAVRVVNILSWPSKAPPEDLARALGASPRELVYTHVGGNTPQAQVNDVAQRIHDGDLKLVLLAGAETMYSARRARARGVDLGWSPRGTPVPNMGDPRPGITEHEGRHGATVPVRIYPMFENALRARYEQRIDEHQRTMGELMASFAAVAAQNPHAWFRDAKSAGEIATPTADNRYIGFPYTKYLNAIMDVDQGAALLLTSTGEARRLGIPENRWVYVWGCGEATDHWYITERVDYHSSPAIRAAGKRALGMAGVSIGEVGHFDLYSCFSSAVQIGRDMLGIAPDDPRLLTVTGGLPYFGGPGNNYVTHSVAAMVGRLRGDRGAIGLVTANGWYVTKHAVGVYSTDPPRRPWERTDPAVDQSAVDAGPHPSFTEEPSGDATVETYTVVFGREGAPELGIVIGRTDDGTRFIANTPSDRALLESMTSTEMVGARGTVTSGDTNIFTPA